MSKPRYCSRCHSMNTWERDFSQDYYTESGIVYMYGWKCKECGSRCVSSNEQYGADRQALAAGNTTENP